MSDPTLILKQAHTRLEMIQFRVKALHQHTLASRHVTKAGLVRHLEEDMRQLCLLSNEIKQVLREGKA